MELVPRELFAPRRFADLARTDVALPLPCGQTMTAPRAVAACWSRSEPAGRAGARNRHRLGYVTARVWRSSAAAVHIDRALRTLAESAAERFSDRRCRGRDHARRRRRTGGGRDRGTIRPHPAQRRRSPSAPGWLDLAARAGRTACRRAGDRRLAAPRPHRPAGGRACSRTSARRCACRGSRPGRRRRSDRA